MKILLFGMVVCFFLNSISFARNERRTLESTHVFVANLMEDFADSSESESCWDSAGNVNKKCEAEIFPCGFKDMLPGANRAFPFVASIYPFSDLRSLGLHVVDSLFLSSKIGSGTKPAWTSELPYPIGIEVLVYGVKSEILDDVRFVKVVAYSRSKINESGKVELLDKAEYQKVYFSIDETLLTKFKDFRLYLDGDFLGDFTNNSGLKLLLPEGRIRLEVQSENSEGLTYRESTILTISKNKGDKIYFSVKPDVSKIQPSQKNVKFQWNKNKKNEFSLLGLNDTKPGIHSIDSIVLGDNDHRIDASKLFVVNNGWAIPVNESMLASFKKNILIPIEFKGYCANYHFKKVFRSYKLLSRPDEASLVLGTLNTEVNQEGIGVFYYPKEMPQNHQRINLNINGSSCVYDESQYLHHVKEVKGDYVNLGPGPWGKAAWAKIPYKSLFDLQNPSFSWNGNTEYFVYFAKDKDENIYMEGSQNKGPDGAAKTIKIRQKIKLRNLIDEKGNFIQKLNCTSG